LQGSLLTAKAGIGAFSNLCKNVLQPLWPSGGRRSENDERRFMRKLEQEFGGNYVGARGASATYIKGRRYGQEQEAAETGSHT